MMAPPITARRKRPQGTLFLFTKTLAPEVQEEVYAALQAVPGSVWTRAEVQQHRTASGRPFRTVPVRRGVFGIVVEG